MSHARRNPPGCNLETRTFLPADPRVSRCEPPATGPRGDRGRVPRTKGTEFFPRSLQDQSAGEIPAPGM
ncbi:uncharacterized protein DNG_06929 [Cephalotrichum gorgonifer]|uniref:Uncharacterized protein n=1 Tax=Cephalotrichum gorgonifer TaxID=2041049 RepID=A0AAE8SWX2_9PEZI|nr:uncharacterized protein DNG_06929 [Cephalotrichum gorgonifer]